MADPIKKVLGGIRPNKLRVNEPPPPPQPPNEDK